MDATRRKAARYRVHLSVRYAAAADFVREYAENLSRGGLFVRGGHGLARRRDLEVDVELPGLGCFRLRAEVMHVIGAEAAARDGRTAGAGLAITYAPPGFAGALEQYLGRLSRRGAVTVLVAADDAADLIAAAGYKVQRPGGRRSAATTATEVHAVVVPGAELEAARGQAAGGLVLAMDGVRELDRVLTALDARL